MSLKEKLDLTAIIAGCAALTDGVLAFLFWQASRTVHDPTTAVLMVFLCGGIGGVVTALATWALIRLWTGADPSK